MAAFAWIERIKVGTSDVNLKKIKEVIFDKLNELIKIDAKEATKIVDEWYGHDHEIVISKITDIKLKTTYLQKLIESKKSTYSNMEAPDREKFNKCLIEYLELKCIQESENIKLQCEQFKKDGRDSVYGILLEYKELFPIDESMKICEKYSIKDGHALLIESKEGGDLPKALSLYIEKINDIIRMLKQRSREGIDNRLKDKFDLLYQCCIRVCIKESHSESKDEKGEVWLKLFTEIYNMWNTERLRVEDLTKSRILKFEELFHNTMNDILKCITERVPLSMQPNIIKSISTQCGGLDFRYYQDLILSMLKSYFDQTRILGSAKSIIGSNNGTLVQEILKIKAKGSSLTDSRCMECDQATNACTTLCTFNCKHIFHESCAAMINGKLMCPLCVEKSVIISEGERIDAVSYTNVKRSFIKGKNPEFLIKERLRKMELRQPPSYCVI